MMRHLAELDALLAFEYLLLDRFGTHVMTVRDRDLRQLKVLRERHRVRALVHTLRRNGGDDYEG